MEALDLGEWPPGNPSAICSKVLHATLLLNLEVALMRVANCLFGQALDFVVDFKEYPFQPPSSAPFVKTEYTSRRRICRRGRGGHP
jgi:hypothetical protein